MKKRLTVEIDEELKKAFKISVAKKGTDMKKRIVALIERDIKE